MPADHPDALARVNRLLRTLRDRVRAVLGDRFVGLYLYGSLATGGFQPGRSDIDFVVATRGPLPEATVEALRAMHAALAERGPRWARKLEGAYVPTAILRRHDPDHPAVPTLNECRFYTAPLGHDWVIQRRVLRETGAVVDGPPLTDVIEPVGAAAVRRAVLAGLEAWWAPMLDDPSRLCDPGYQPYAVLSMCRALHTVETGALGSKADAAAWALAALPKRWAPLIRHAVRWREGGETESIARTMAFIRYAVDRCRGAQVRDGDPQPHSASQKGDR